MEEVQGEEEEKGEGELEVLVEEVVRREGGTSTLGTVFLIVNAALGAGLLNFPKAFDQAGGVLVAVTVQVLVAVTV